MIKDIPVQETDSVRSISNWLSLNIYSDVTVAVPSQDPCSQVIKKNENYPVYLPNRVYPTFLRAILSSLNELKNENVAKEVFNLIKTIQSITFSLQDDKLIDLIFQRLHLFNIEDDTALLEWIFEDYRIGFGVDTDPNESSWYLVTQKELGNINAYGYLSEDNNANIITWLITFISMN